MVPLNTRNSNVENISILRDAKVDALLFGSEFMDQLSYLQVALPDLKKYICHGNHSGDFVDYENMIASSDTSEPNIDVDENDIYRIHYTSGTTGQSRGIVHTYRNRKEVIANMFINSDYLITENDVVLHVAPLTHAAGYFLTPFYLKGAKHIILAQYDTDVLLETVEQEKVTCMLLVPTMINMLLENNNISTYNLSSLKRIYYGTAPMSVTKLKRAISTFGNIFRQNYGLSEAIQPLTSLLPSEHVLAGDEEQVNRLASAGRRSIGPEIRIVDSDESNIDVPVGEIGEIIVRSPHVTPGYLDQPDLTQKTIKNGWFYTGDLAYKDKEGYIFIVDRKKEMIITGGFNVYAREVESILEQHPFISESVVVGCPDEKWGETVKAFVVAAVGGNKPDLQELTQFCIGKGLTKYKLPRIIEHIDSIPKNNYGKIMKKELKNN